MQTVQDNLVLHVKSVRPALSALWYLKCQLTSSRMWRARAQVVQEIKVLRSSVSQREKEDSCH